MWGARDNDIGVTVGTGPFFVGFQGDKLVQGSDQVLGDRVTPAGLDKFVEIVQGRVMIFCLEMVLEGFALNGDSFVNDQECLPEGQTAPLYRVRIISHLKPKMLSQLPHSGLGKGAQTIQPGQFFFQTVHYSRVKIRGLHRFPAS